MSRATRRPPSDLLHIGEWAAELIGMPYDEWTPLQFDAAVSYFGTWVENRLQKFHPKTGKALYKLEDLLEPKAPPSWHGFFASAGIRVRKG